MKKKLLERDFFYKYNFNKPKRFFCKHDQQFRIYYEIEGDDCNFLVSPVPQSVPNDFNEDGIHEFMSLEEQVDVFSNIELLENHHINSFAIYVNSLDNHITNFHYEEQLLEFMRICNKPLKLKS